MAADRRRSVGAPVLRFEIAPEWSNLRRETTEFSGMLSTSLRCVLHFVATSNDDDLSTLAAAVEAERIERRRIARTMAERPFRNGEKTDIEATSEAEKRR